MLKDFARELNSSHALELSRESDYSVALIQANPHYKVCVTWIMQIFPVISLHYRALAICAPPALIDSSGLRTFHYNIAMASWPC